MIKKMHVLSLLFVSLALFVSTSLPIPVRAAESSNFGVSTETRSTAAYYYWRQRSSRYLRTESVGGWINKGTPIRISQKGGTNSQTVTYSQPTIGIDISVSGKILAGGISVTPGSSRTIVSTFTSPALNVGNYQPQYKKMRNVYSVVQDRYYYEFGHEELVSTKTGTIKVGTDATWRWIGV